MIYEENIYVVDIVWICVEVKFMVLQNLFKNLLPNFIWM